jgi:hypothetical protein
MGFGNAVVRPRREEWYARSYYLVVSRSRSHGLRPSQPSITFFFRETVLQVHIQIDGVRTLELPTSQIDGERIMEELGRLASCPID